MRRAKFKRAVTACRQEIDSSQFRLSLNARPMHAAATTAPKKSDCASPVAVVPTEVPGPCEAAAEIVETAINATAVSGRVKLCMACAFLM